MNVEREHLSDFIRYSRAPLSIRAATGFKGRLDASGLKYPDSFGSAIAAYVENATRPSAVA
jgi:hypothetical protein